jgi:hypothetical protein
MTGYCGSCGNQICVCDEVATQGRRHDKPLGYEPMTLEQLDRCIANMHA